MWITFNSSNVLFSNTDVCTHLSDCVSEIWRLSGLSTLLKWAVTTCANDVVLGTAVARCSAHRSITTALSEQAIIASMCSVPAFMTNLGSFLC